MELLTPKKVITVFGSTGSQGSSVVEALLKQGNIHVRAATRNIDSAKAKALESRGVELVQASFSDYDSLLRALQGAYGCFFLTSFWDQREHTITAEIAVGEAVGRACKASNVQHVIYSSLESPAAMGAGFAFPTFDGKVGVEQALMYLGLPLTVVQVAWYFNNLENNNPNPHSGFYSWPRDETGAYVLEVPIGAHGLHGIHNLDVGESCASIFAQRAEFIGRKVALSGELVTGEEMVSCFRDTFPEHRFVYLNTDIEAYKAKTAGFGDALYNMYKWYQYRMPLGGDVALSKALNPSMRTFREYLRDRKHCFKFE